MTTWLTPWRLVCWKARVLLAILLAWSLFDLRW